MKERIFTGVIIALLFLAVFVVGKEPFTYLMLILSIIAFFELNRMMKAKYYKYILGAMGILIIFSPLLFDVSESMLPNFILGYLLLLLTTTITCKDFSIIDSGMLLIATLYIGFGFELIAEARIEKGIIWTIMVILIIWATDTGAYFIGKKFGRTKLAIRISPNKTIEGSIGGIIVAIVTGVIVQYKFLIFDNYSASILMIIFISILGQLGDLVESAIKRHFGVKDSGNILPGHGGILDRLDSWLFVFIGLKVIGMI